MGCDILMFAYSVICLISLRDWKDLKALSSYVAESSEVQNVHYLALMRIECMDFVLMHEKSLKNAMPFHVFLLFL